MKKLWISFNDNHICPYCKGSNTKRIRRSIPDHRFPSSKRYSCSRCGLEYLHFAKIFYLVRRY